MASVSSLDQDMKNLRMGKYTAEAALEARNWIESVLGEAIPDNDLMEGLRDGVVLCKLVNKLNPNTARYKESEMPFKQMENISLFLKICSMPPISIPAHDLFLTVDLYESKDPAQVLQTIQSFSRKAHAQKPSVFPQPIGPKLGSTSNTPVKAKPPVPSRSPAVSTWAKPEDEGVTQPAWNIATYGYIGGSNQEKMGVSFGGRRQITSASPHVPSIREKEERRRKEEQEAADLRIAEEQKARRDEERAQREEERLWRQQEEEDRRRIEREEERERKRVQEQEARREEARRKEEQWEKEQMERQEQRQTKLEREREEENKRIKELERELEQARERERRYLQEAHRREQETQAVEGASAISGSPGTTSDTTRRPAPSPKPKPTIGSKPLPHATLAAQRQRELQDEDEDEAEADESNKKAPTPSTPPPTPPRATGSYSPAKSPPAFGARTGSMIGRGGKVGETLIEREIRLERERQRDWERNQELLKEERSKMTPQELEDARNGLTEKHDSKRYFGGANQGNMGVSFGSKRQIIGNPPQ